MNAGGGRCKSLCSAQGRLVPPGRCYILSPARIDLLLTDVGLPGGMNGRQLADAARQHRPDLKILFITGYDEQAAFESGQMAAGMAIMSKPFNIDTFSTKVKDILGAPSAKLETN